ncbi:MAG: methyltransferase domain-containing protein [Candidatus Altiarchaeota archaeon]
MIGRLYGHPEIVSAMTGHSVARAKYGRFFRSFFNTAGPVIIRIFGYPLDMEVQRRVKPICRMLDLKEAEKVLDVGCGIGYFTFNSAVGGCSPAGCASDSFCVGADLDVEDMNLAGTVKKVKRVKNACFAAADGLELPFKKDSFDRVLASELIEHIRDDASLLGEFARVLKPGGVLVLTTPYTTHPVEYKKEHYKKIRKEKIGGGHVRSGYNLASLGEKLGEVGFQIQDHAYSYGAYTRFARGIIKSFLWLGAPIAWIISSLEDYTLVKEGKCIIVSARKI